MSQWGRDEPREDISNRYTSNFKDKDIDPVLSRMLGEMGPISTTTSEKISTSSKCDGCGRPIPAGEEYVQAQQDKKYHKQCFNADVRCGRCSKPIFGEVIAALDKNWHPACFVCCRCETKLMSSFLERNGDPYCNTCGNQPTSSRTHNYYRGPTEEEKRQAERKKAEAAEVFSNIQKGKTVCVECGRVIAGMGFTFQSASYHEECFKCGKCSQSLSGKGVMEKDGELVCESCAKGLGGFREKCVACLKPLEGKWLTANNHKYHHNCFLCFKCRKPFEGGGYVERDGKPLHPACAGPQQTTKTVVTGERRPGFTVDPRTGQKKYAS